MEQQLNNQEVSSLVPQQKNPKPIKPFWIIILVILVLVLVGSLVWSQYFFSIKLKIEHTGQLQNNTQPVIQTNVPTDWLNYKNEQYGFELKYPKGYAPQEGKIGDKIAGFFTENYPQQQNRELLFDISIISKQKITDAKVDFSDLSKVGDYLVRDYKVLTSDGSMLLNNGIVKLGITDWYKMTLIGTQKGDVATIVLINKGNDSAVLLESPSSRSDIEDVMSSIASSFRWIPVVSQNTQNQGEATQLPAIGMNFKKYSNTEQKYEISYPEGWNKGYASGGSTSFTKNWDTDDSCIIKVKVAPENDSGSDFNRKTTESQSSSNSAVLIDGTQATQYDFGPVKSSVKREIWLVRGGNIYYFYMFYHTPSLQEIASSQAYQQHSAECLSAFSQMSSSFKDLR